MARAYSQDLRERVLEAAAKGMSARQAAERFGVGVSTAIVWVRRARVDGERSARRQGQPRGSKLDAQRDYLLGLVEATTDITLKEMQARLREEKGVAAGSAPCGASSGVRTTRSKNGLRRRAGPGRRARPTAELARGTA